MLLNVGVRVKVDAFEGSKQPVVDVSVTHVRAGAHSESIARIARFGAACAKHAAALSPPATAVEDASSDASGAASFEPGCLTVKIADASVFVPSPRRFDPVPRSSFGTTWSSAGASTFRKRWVVWSRWTLSWVWQCDGVPSDSLQALVSHTACPAHLSRTVTSTIRADAMADHAFGGDTDSEIPGTYIDFSTIAGIPLP